MQKTQESIKLTLSSHPGKAIVMRDRGSSPSLVDTYNGHDVNWFTIGDADKALEVNVEY